MNGLRNVALAVLVGLSAGCDGELTETVDTVVCESGKRWVGDDEGSSEMMPGEPCLKCHSGNTDGPRFGFAGTVYDSGDQGERCFGASGVTLVVKDADGIEHSLTTNGAGNFFSTVVIPTPYTAWLVVDGAPVPMVTPQTNGDCNSCHRVGGAAGLRIFTGN